MINYELSNIIIDKILQCNKLYYMPKINVDTYVTSSINLIYFGENLNISLWWYVGGL